MTMEYYGTGNASLEFPFNFVLLSNGNESSRPADIKEYIAEWMDVMPTGGVANWVVSDYSLCSCSSECSDKCLCLSQARNYTVHTCFIPFPCEHIQQSNVHKLFSEA